MLRPRLYLAFASALTIAACSGPSQRSQAPHLSPAANRNAAHVLVLSSQNANTGASLTAGPVLAVSGSIGPGNAIVVDPVYALQSSEATDDGPYEMTGADRAGHTIFRTHFDAMAAGDPGARAFAVEVPVSQAALNRLAALHVRAGDARAIVVGTGASQPQAHVFRDRAGRFAIAWNARAFPEIAMSNERPGSVLNLVTATGGHAVLATPARSVTVDFSNGLRSYREVFNVR